MTVSDLWGLNRYAPWGIYLDLSIWGCEVNVAQWIVRYNREGSVHECDVVCPRWLNFYFAGPLDSCFNAFVYDFASNDHLKIDGIICKAIT